MKKIVSILLTIVMVVSMFTTVSAATIADHTSKIPNPMKLELAVEVLARETAKGGEYGNALSMVEAELVKGIGVDYQATLDMAPVRALFDKSLIKTVFASDPAAQAEFDAGKVTTEVTVAIEYPAAAKFKSADLTNKTVGRLDAGEIFAEKSRSNAGNVLTIVYQNKENLTVKELTENRDTYLKDIAFYLENEVSYNSEADHQVRVTMNGSTTIDFSSKDQVVTYQGSSSHIVSANKYHELVVVPAVPATCTTEGKTEGVMCNTHKGWCDGCNKEHNGFNCDARGIVEQKTISKIPHQTVLFDEVQATCSSTGIKEHYICLLCKGDFADIDAKTPLRKEDITIGKKEHTMVNAEAAVPATCTENGLSAGQHCSVCGYRGTRTVIFATGHSEKTIPAVDATCTTPGSTEGKECSTCHQILVATKPIPAKGHTFGEWEIVTPATQNNEGLKKRTCTCGEEETITIPKEAHVCEIDEKAAVVTKPATCTEDGTKQNYCACGEPVGDPIVIPALGHKAAPNSHVNEQEATCTDKGMIEHWACANCGGFFRDAECTKAVQSVEIPIDPHNHGAESLRTIPAVAATCEKDGLKEGTKCIKCNYVIKPQEVDRKGHHFQEVAAKDATCEDKGVVAHKHCTVCNKDFSLDETQEFKKEDCELPALGHIFGEIEYEKEEDKPTEDKEGNGIRYCERDRNHSKMIKTAKLKHVHTEECEEIVTPATCTKNGKKRVVYTCCGVVKQDNIIIPAEHKSIEVAEVAATCYSDGVKGHWYCTVCEKLFEDKDCKKATNLGQLKIHKLKHDFQYDHETDTEIVNVCQHAGCQEIVNIKKKGKSSHADVKDHGGMKGESGKTKEENRGEDHESKNIKITVESNINIQDREISAVLEEKLPNKDKAGEEKIVLDIFIEKVTTYQDGNDNDKVVDVDKELLSETEDLVIIEIVIPAEMRHMIDFQVHRLHKENGQDIPETITTNKNARGEYIEIAADKSKVTLHVRRFSEYALVGYEEKVNPDPVTPGSGSGGSVGGLYPVIKFHVNGGTVLDNIVVKPGEKITLPIPEREGYTFGGWFTDVALTKPFDPEAPITGPMTLYAKWMEGVAGPCDGTEAMNCPCLQFVDLDPTLWYHTGVDYVLNNGLMVGTEETVFEPDSSLTRAMLVTVLWRAEGKINAANDCKFADVESGSYYEEAVAWAEECGIVTGYNDTEFGPHDNILREQIAAIMYRYSKFKGYDVSAGENTNILSYADVAEISEYAIPAMQYAVGSGLMKGRTESTLNPQSDTTRAEIAVILHRFFTAHQ